MTTTKIREGVIMIPDFSGFTDFVSNTCFSKGEYIIKELLSTLISSNDNYFYLSDIEGDAILLYKYTKKPSYEKIIEALLRMHSAFNEKIAELSKRLEVAIPMSLKFILHYGEFSKYEIKRRNQLYGKTIIDAHRMLKNNRTTLPSYILHSDAFLEAIKEQLLKANKAYPDEVIPL